MPWRTASGTSTSSMRSRRAGWWSSGLPSVREAGVLLLPRLDPEGQPVLGGRQRAGGEGREGAGRVVGQVEIDEDLAVLDRAGLQEAAGAVGLLAVGLVGEDQGEPLFRIAEGIQTVGLPLPVED